MAGLKGKSGPPGNMNAFKHGLAAIQKRREESISTEHEESVRQQILEGFMAEWVLNNPEYTREMATFSSPLTTKKLPPRLTYSDLSTKVTVKLSAAAV